MEERAFEYGEARQRGGGLALLQGLLIPVSPGRYPALGTEKRILYMCVLSVRLYCTLDSGYGSQMQQDWRIKSGGVRQMLVVSVTELNK